MLYPSFPLRSKRLSCASPSQLVSAPCHLDLSFSSSSAGATARTKDPPWMALVQAEPKKKPAPPPPPGSSHETPSRTSEEDGEEVGKTRSEESRFDATEPKAYNPFEEEDEEEEESAATQKSTPEQEQSETAAKPLHPWYGITPTSSPKTKKRPAPRAPSASPLGEPPSNPSSLFHHSCVAPWRHPLPRCLCITLHGQAFMQRWLYWDLC